jgi:hypothetical protein
MDTNGRLFMIELFSSIGVFLRFSNFLLSDYYVMLLLSTIMIVIGFSKPRCFQRLGRFVPLSFAAFVGKIQATRCVGGR